VFSYIKKEKLSVAFSNVHKLLNPGGIFIFDVVNGSQLDAKFEKSITVKGDGVDIAWERTRESNEQVIEAYAKIHADKIYEDHQTFFYYYPEEIKRLLEDAGFGEIEVYSDYNRKKDYTKSKTKLCVVCRK